MKDSQHEKFWKNLSTNELGRLAQGVGKRVKGMDKILSIDYDDITSEHHIYIAYENIMVDYRPQKDDPNSTWLTVGGNIVEYPGDLITPTADTTAAKIV